VIGVLFELATNGKSLESQWLLLTVCMAVATTTILWQYLRQPLSRILSKARETPTFLIREAIVWFRETWR